MSNLHIQLALQGQKINSQIKQLSSQLEQIKKQLREIASDALSNDEVQNAVFDINDNGVIISQVRFPPSTISLSPSHIEKVISLIGKEEFDRLFTVRKQVICQTDQLENLSSDVAELLGDYISLKENTPRVSFK